jgi:hypothetical protein
MPHKKSGIGAEGLRGLDKPTGNALDRGDGVHNDWKERGVGEYKYLSEIPIPHASSANGIIAYGGIALKNSTIGSAALNNVRFKPTAIPSGNATPTPIKNPVRTRTTLTIMS